MRDLETASPKVFSQTSYDEHILLVAGRNLVRALARVPARLGTFALDGESATALQLLRDIYEHWDETLDPIRDKRPVSGKSRSKLVAAFPKGTPFAIEYGDRGAVIGGILVLKDFSAALRQMEATASRVREQLIGQDERERRSAGSG